jgi:hypothetical protein
MKKQAEMVRNGMISVPNISIEYKGFTIRPKLDMGSTPWLVNGNEYRRGYIVTRNDIQIMPGGAWFTSVIEARFAIDILIEAREDGPTFWNLWNEYSGRNEYESV